MMWFAILGAALVLMKVLDIGPPAQWDLDLFGDLWKFVLPFLLAAIWWAWADASGLSRRREMDKLERRKEERRERNLDAMGLGETRRRDRR